MSITFNPSPAPTLGVELELQLVDRKTRQLTPLGPEVLRALKDNPHVKPELLQSTIELNTGVCDNVQEIRRDLETVLAEVRPVCDSLGCELLSAGTHPFSTWPVQAITEQPRYRDLVDRVQWPAQRLMIFGLHVHVGMDSAEKSVAVFNALTGCIPQLLALSASSPFWQGNDTGLASVRSKEAQKPDDHVILPELISKEPLGPSIRRGDDEFFAVSKWVLNALLEAEEFGITSANVDKMKAESKNPGVMRLLGAGTEDTGKLLGLDKDWAHRIIKSVGNYGEIFERHVGPKTSIGLPRGSNNLWTQGGLMYAPPVR